MKGRQLKHIWGTRQEVSVKKQHKQKIWKATVWDDSGELFTHKDLYWWQMERFHKRQKPATDRGIKFRSSRKKERFLCQNVVQKQSRDRWKKEHSYEL